MQEKVVASAKADEQRAADREAALKLRDELKTFVALGKQMDEHPPSLRAHRRSAKKSTQRIHDLRAGCSELESVWRSLVPWPSTAC